MEKLTEGMQVEIIRSDGRVHGAIICQINHKTSSVSVEWFEKVCILEICIAFLIFRERQKGKKWILMP